MRTTFTTTEGICGWRSGRAARPTMRYLTGHILPLFLLALYLAATARANDTAVRGIGGSITPLSGEHPSVRMVREQVRMDLYRDSYDTAVDFVFVNDDFQDSEGRCRVSRNFESCTLGNMETTVATVSWMRPITYFGEIP